jgi:hypothetical protein
MAERSRELEELLHWARARGFYLHVSDPGRIMVLARAVPRTIDIAHIRGPASVAAARLVNDARANIWRPFSIVTHYYGDCTHALEYLKSLTDTDTPTLNSRPYTPPGRSTDGVNPLYVTDTERAKMKVYRPTTNHPMEAPNR